MSNLRALWSRIVSAILRGVVRRVTSSTTLQTLQIRANGQTLDGVEFFETHGFTAAIDEGAEVLVLSLGGSTDHPVAVAAPDRRFRPVDLQPGEVAIYDKHGKKILLKDNGVVVVSGANAFRVEGDLQVTGDVVHTGDYVTTGSIQAGGDILDNALSGGATMKAHRDTYNTHTHNGGSSGPPDQTV